MSRKSSALLLRDAPFSALETENRALKLRLSRVHEEHQLLEQMRRLLVQHVDLGTMIHAVVNGIGEFYGYSLVSLYLLEDDTLVLQHQIGYEQQITHQPVSHGVMGRVARTGEAALLADVQDEPIFIAAVEGIQSEICVPLLDENGVVGVLNVETRASQPLGTRDLDLMQAISELLGIALHRTRLYDESLRHLALYQSLIDNINEIIFQTDVQGRLTFVNAAWEKVLGFSVAETLSAPLAQFIHADDREAAVQSIADFVVGVADTCTHEGRYVTKLGEVRWLRADARLMRDSAGAFAGVAGSFSDFTLQKRAQENERQQQRLVDALSATAEALTTTLDMHRLFDLVFAHLRPVMPEFTAARAMLLDGNDVYMVRSVGYEQVTDADEIANLRVPYRIIPEWEQMIRSGTPDLVIDLYTHPNRGKIAKFDWLRSTVGASLRVKGHVIGMIHLDSRQPNIFQPVHAEWLQAFADLAGAAVQNAQLHARVQLHARELEARVADRTAAYLRAKTQVETILSTSSDSILLLTSRGRIQQVNPAFTRLTGYEGDWAYNQPLAHYAHTDSVESIQIAVSHVANGESQRLEIKLNRRDGQVVIVDAGLDPIKTFSGDAAIVCTMHDVTERRQMEGDLRRALDDERRLNELKTRFSITVSHEFRTPLQLIQSSTDKLARYFHLLTPEKRNEALLNIERQVTHLKNLLEDITTISKADTIGMDFEPEVLDLVAFIGGVVEEMRWLSTSRHTLRFITAACGNAYADPTLLRRMLNNLIGNAMKYSPEESEIKITLLCDDTNFTLQVCDNGIGIPRADQDKVFEMYHRAANAENIPGTGLGLAIVRRAVELHGGTITFESVIGEGTTFTITLPRQLPVVPILS